ncbi:uncharacterized protein LOC114577443 [Apis cerana]|uniref:uncharacterized protein LOC114577443 n=1 Tax=Apis cerana TaxID=7461 RepID=UPI00109BC606|nr:uncharacterized protein LOC114577443 [Apis cerana]
MLRFRLLIYYKTRKKFQHGCYNNRSIITNQINESVHKAIIHHAKRFHFLLLDDFPWVSIDSNADSLHLMFSRERASKQQKSDRHRADDDDEDDVSGGGSVAGDINPRKLHRLRPTGSRSSRTCV